MKRIFRFLRTYYEYWLVLVTIGAALVLQTTGFHTATHWLLCSVSILALFLILNRLWQEVHTGRYGINILAAIGIVAALLLRQYWTATVLVTVSLGGKIVEEYVRQRATRELRILRARTPVLAHVIRARKTLNVRASDIKAGEQIVIEAGEVVPVDAIITDGMASFDESWITSETAAEVRAVGEQILSGTINLDGTVTAKSLHSEHDSQLAQTIRMLRSATASQSPFSRLADRFSIPFTIMALVIAVVAWIMGHEAVRFLEVIVVATPGPLLLATPIALMAGISRASKLGIVVRSGSAFEKLADAETFAFAKTGILTRGEPNVVKVEAYGKHTQSEILSLASSLEQHSNHVLASAIVNATISKKMKAVKTKHVSHSPGRGLSAMLQGQEVLVGRLSFLQEHDVTLPVRFAPKNSKQTAIFVAVNGELAGVITFQDELQPGSKPTLRALRAIGIAHTAIISGDTMPASKAVAKQMGINDVMANALLAEKVHAAEQFENRPVVFVGDGVKHASVLATADVGIALGARGNTAATESADIVILQNDITRVAQALAIAKRTFALARQSILVGVSLSVALMVIFASGTFPALLGAFLQGLVDVMVIFNALRAHNHTAKEAHSWES